MSVNTHHLAVHQLVPRDRSANAETAVMIDKATGEPFDVLTYSELKYGRVRVGHTYALALARLFVESLPELAVTQRRLLITGPPFPVVTPPVYTVITEFIRLLNIYRVTRGLEPARSLHVIKWQVGTDHYAMADPALRETIYEMPGKTRHVDAELVRDAVVITIDDINVTGATNRRLIRILEECRPHSICNLHVASIVDQEWVHDNADIEDVMNKAGEPCLETFEAAILENDFRLCSRVFHFIMKWPNEDKLGAFLRRRTNAFLVEMHAGLVNGSAERYTRDPKSTALLECIMVERGMQISPLDALLTPAAQ